MNKTLARGGVIALALGLGTSAFAGQTGNTGMTGNSNGKMQRTTESANAARAQKGRPAQAQKGAGQTAWNQAEANSVRLSSLDQQQVMGLQAKLKDLGLYQGKQDGAFGPETRAALSQYFANQAKLLQDNRIGDTSLAAFGFDQNEIQRVRGVDQQQGNQRQPTRGYEQPTGQKQQKRQQQPNGQEQSRQQSKQQSEQ